jgi:hypothetical protein
VGPEPDFDLIYRRGRVPTKKTFQLDLQPPAEAWIDLEHFRRCRSLPDDVIECHGRWIIGQGVVGDAEFVVDRNTLEY